MDRHLTNELYSVLNIFKGFGSLLHTCSSLKENPKVKQIFFLFLFLFLFSLHPFRILSFVELSISETFVLRSDISLTFGTGIRSLALFIKVDRPDTAVSPVLSSLKKTEEVNVSPTNHYLFVVLRIVAFYCFFD